MEIYSGNIMYITITELIQLSNIGFYVCDCRQDSSLMKITKKVLC